MRLPFRWVCRCPMLARVALQSLAAAILVPYLVGYVNRVSSRCAPEMLPERLFSAIFTLG